MDIGERFGRYVLVIRAENGKASKRRWNVQCDCGIGRIVFEYNLKNGNSRSCGCLSADLSSKRENIHGACPQRGGQRRNAPEYNSWFGIIQRCENHNNPSYQYYGGRGISVCVAWRDNFQAFFADMGRRPGYGYSIDRIDVNGNYEPGNCRWADAKTQQNNRRNTGKNFKGETHHVGQ